jgi:hypothetical protein
MNDHARWLVDHEDMSIFMDDTKGNGFRLTGNGFGGGNAAGNVISGFDPITGFFKFIYNPNSSFTDKLGGHGAGASGNYKCDDGVETISGMFIRNDKRKRTAGRHQGEITAQWPSPG